MTGGFCNSRQTAISPSKIQNSKSAWFVRMVRTVERIERELALLDQAVATIAQEFYDTYSQYLTAFSQAVRQQLILASFHLCTHGYPERFVNLSLNQRQQLQRSLRQLTKTAQTNLLDRLQSVEDSKASFDESLLGSIEDLRNAELEEQFSIEEISIEEISIEEIAIGNVELSSNLFDISLTEQPPHEQPPEAEPEKPESAEPELTEPELIELKLTEPEPIEQPQSEQPQSEQSQSEQSQSEQSQSEQPSPTPEPSEPDPISPKDLVYWQEQLEESIVEELQNLSHAANRLLQQAEILPSRLPEPVLEVAAKADLASESAVSPPNLLNLLIETEDEDEKESTMTHLMAIRLRLSEIEFSDSASSLWRSKIRDLSTRLNKLGREYQKKQKERSIAQAEAAWRSSWYED